MRSAGCIVNDILDRKFDKKVLEQKIDQLHQEKFQFKLGLFYAFIFVFISFFSFNKF